MSYLIILGIIVIAIGTFIIYLGSKKDDESSQQTLIDRITNFSNELNAIQNESQDNLEKSAKITDLANEFDSWASSLRENHPEIQLSYNKLMLELSEKEWVLNKEWRTFFIDIFKNIENMTKAINKSLSEQDKILIFKNGVFPLSLFNNEEQKYDWILKFDEYNYWKIELYRFRLKQENSQLPTIAIFYSNDINKLNDSFGLKDEFSLSFYRESIYCDGKGTFRFIDTSKFLTTVYIESINEILKTCLQYQLIQIKKFTNSHNSDKKL